MIFNNCRFRAAYLALVILLGCRKEEPVPSLPQLVLPRNNEVCTTSEVISDKESKVSFSWRSADRADTYILNIKNLTSGATSSITTDKLSQTISLGRNTPYSWSVSARNNKSGKETPGSTWKFYNPGLPSTSYAPFPADLLTPKFEEVVSADQVTLKWVCSDPDVDDKLTFTVYLGLTQTPPLLKRGIPESLLADVPLTRHKRYYWRVEAVDNRGNKSISEVYTFTVS